MRFVEGVLELPTESSPFSAELFEQVLFGHGKKRAEPVAAGQFEVITIPSPDGEATYRFNYEQTFTLPGGETFQVNLFSLDFTARGEVPVEKTSVMDESFQPLLMSSLLQPGQESDAESAALALKEINPKTSTRLLIQALEARTENFESICMGLSTITGLHHNLLDYVERKGGYHGRWPLNAAEHRMVRW